MWQREKMPLLFHAGLLVWVPGWDRRRYACGGRKGFAVLEGSGKAPLC
jgi:hypothetical protein